MSLSMGDQMKLLLIEAQENQKAHIETEKNLKKFQEKNGVHEKQQETLLYIQLLKNNERVARAKLKYLQELMREADSK